MNMPVIVTVSMWKEGVILLVLLAFTKADNFSFGYRINGDLLLFEKEYLTESPPFWNVIIPVVQYIGVSRFKLEIEKIISY